MQFAEISVKRAEYLLSAFREVLLQALIYIECILVGVACIEEFPLADYPLAGQLAYPLVMAPGGFVIVSRLAVTQCHVSLCQ
jgi:hypothetical protein